MKRIAPILALLLAVLTLASACGKKYTPITAADFKTRMEGDGYTVVDAKATTPVGENAESILIAKNDSTGLQIEFYVLNSEDIAKAVYENTKDGYENDGTSGTTGFVSIGNHASYQKKTSDAFRMIARVDNTMLLCSTEAANGDQVKDLFKALGY